jgi:hypothetical protein
MLLRDQGGELIEVPLQQRSVAIENLDPLLNRSAGPRWKGCPSRDHGGGDLGPGRQGNPGEETAVAWIQHVQQVAGAAAELPGDVIAHRGIFLRSGRWYRECRAHEDSWSPSITCHFPPSRALDFRLFFGILGQPPGAVAWISSKSWIC